MSRTVEFVKSAVEPSGFIKDNKPVIVFAGRSNVGKSSMINALLNRKALARVSGTPGKTLHVNYFLVDGKQYFVDLPGYGFSKVSDNERERWDTLMQAFFERKELIALGVLVVDIRHQPTKDDILMSELLFSSGYPCVVAANKSDKLKPSQIEPSLDLIRETLSLESDIPLIPFSSKSKSGKDALERAIFSKV